MKRSGAVLAGLPVHGVSLDGTHYRDLQAAGVDLRNASMAGVDLSGTRYRDLVTNGVDVATVDLRGLKVTAEEYALLVSKGLNMSEVEIIPDQTLTRNAERIVFTKEKVAAMGAAIRTEWTEFRDGDFFFVIGELDPNGWSFWDRSPWEVRWFPLEATPNRLEIANRLARSMRQQSTEDTLYADSLFHFSLTIPPGWVRQEFVGEFARTGGRLAIGHSSHSAT